MTEPAKFIVVTRQVIERFLAELESIDATLDVAKRLRSTLLEKARVSEKDLREVLFPTNNP